MFHVLMELNNDVHKYTSELYCNMESQSAFTTKHMLGDLNIIKNQDATQLYFLSTKDYTWAWTL